MEELYALQGAKVQKKLHMRKRNAIFFGVKAGGICQSTGKSKTGGGLSSANYRRELDR